MPKTMAGVAALAVTSALLVLVPGTADAATARTFKNCTQLNKTYQHGVGRKGARDHVSGSSRPVRNFTVNTAVYRANKKSDRDGDGIACEKR